jgi:hypothetical protein
MQALRVSSIFGKLYTGVVDILHAIRIRSYPVPYSTSSSAKADIRRALRIRQAFEKQPMNGKLFGTGRISVSSLGKIDIR